MHTDTILSFLADLKTNNSREWMSKNKNRYLEAKADFENLIQKVIDGIISFDPNFQHIEIKQCILRLNRDIRFSHDKTPYKTSFAAVIAPEGGKKSVLPCYYLSLAPETSFVAGGLYLPSGEYLKKVRQEIDYNGNELLSIINAPTFKNTFTEIEGNRLKTSPRGYQPDHPFIDLLRLKSFIIRKEISSSKNVLEDALTNFKTMKPFNDFLFMALE